MNEKLFFNFQNEDLWSYDRKSKKWERMNLQEVFPGIKTGVRGGTLSNDGYLWFFKEKTVWAYLDYELVDGFPKAIKDSKYPSEPESAINVGGKFYLIKV